MLTFSRKACREMYARLAARLDVFTTQRPMPTIETYHSFGFKLVKKHPELCRRQSNPSLLDESDQKKLFRECIKELENVDHEKINEKNWFSVYDHSRNEGYDARDSRHSDRLLQLFTKHGVIEIHHQPMLQCFSTYERKKEEGNLVDYGDLQVLPVQALKANLDWAKKLGHYFTDIVIDESQDTNSVQYNLVDLIGSMMPKQQLTMIGDDDQTIYGWRGAKAINLQRFLQQYSPSIIKLEKNYRSPSTIVDPATKLIRNNEKRIEKNPYSASPKKDAKPVAFYGHPNGDVMADRLATWIKKTIDSGVRPNHIAILFRTNRMAKVLEPALIAKSVPYRIQQGFDLFSRQEVQMVMAAIRLATNPRDYMAFKKISTLIKGFGEKRQDQVIQAFKSDYQSNCLFEKANEILGLKTQVGQSVATMALRIAGLREMDPFDLQPGRWALDVEGGDFGPWLKQLAQQSTSNKQANLDARIEAILSLDKAISSRLKQVDLSKISQADMWGLIMEMALSTPDEEDDNSDSVILSTIHKSKGLEYPIVHIVGFSEGLIPSIRDNDSNFDTKNLDEIALNLEEERRLAYVGATRAKTELVLHHADRIFFGHETCEFNPSRFATEAGIPLKNYTNMNQSEQALSTKNSIAISSILKDLGWSQEDCDINRIRQDDLDPLSSLKFTRNVQPNN